MTVAKASWLASPKPTSVLLMYSAGTPFIMLLGTDASNFIIAASTSIHFFAISGGMI